MAAWLDLHNVYRKQDNQDVDCRGLRPLRDHLFHLADVVEELGLISPSPLPTNLICQWLQMAAGLEFVDLNMRPPGCQTGYCGIADDFDDAMDHIHGQFATENTRLMYVWNATERLIPALGLTDAPGRKGQYNSASNFLASVGAADALPEHYECIACHLQCHVRAINRQVPSPKLVNSFRLEQHRDNSGTLLHAGNQLRNMPAHGDLLIPADSAPEWDSGRIPKLPQVLHTQRLGARGLALSIQQLLAHWLSSSLLVSPTFRADWLVREEDVWVRRETPRAFDLLMQAHVRPSGAALREEHILEEEMQAETPDRSRGHICHFLD